MSRGNNVMIGIGAAVIVGMLVVAAFSLGVYVGEHGWTAQGISLAGPAQGQQRPPGGQPPGQPPGQSPPGGQPGGPVQGTPLPSRPPNLVGRVRALQDRTLFLATRDGPRAVELTTETVIRTARGEPAGLESLQPGIPVAVFGHPAETAQTLAVDVLVLLPEQQAP